jgi:glutathione synthase/RimK-type ligase-like ATP-grasp enzyme
MIMTTIWVSIEPMEQAEQSNKLWVPEDVFHIVGDHARLTFGQRIFDVAIASSGQAPEAAENSFDTPSVLRINPCLSQALLLAESNIYQMVCQRNEISLGPVIGLLLGEQHYYYHHDIMDEYTDAVSSYKRMGGLLYVFKYNAIDWVEKVIYGLYFSHQEQRWKYGKFPIPSVIYRRAFTIPEDVVEKLAQITNGNIFNSKRFTKWQLYKKLQKDRELIKHLPETIKLVKLEQVETFIDHHPNIILKPIGLSRGRGICIIQRGTKDVFYLQDYHDGSRMSNHTLSKEETLHYIESNQFVSKNYIMQPYLNLAKINGSPWDIRVVMQKNSKGKWACHGIECRVAGMENLVTNISRGGQALSIAKALKLSFGPGINTSKTKKQIIEVCKKLAICIEKDNGTFAELGIDIAMDTDQNLWIIEANVRPTYNGFKHYMDYQNYLFLCSAPLRFASKLAGFKGG